MILGEKSMGKYEQPKRKREPRSTAQRKESGGGGGKGLIAGLVIAGTLVVAAVVGVVGYAAAVAKSDTIFPNVLVAGVDVGGMSREAATEAVRNAVDSTYGTSTLIVKLPDRTLSFDPEVTKISLDVEGAIDEAWSYGRDKGIFNALRNRLSPGSSVQEINIEQSLTLDEALIRSTIDQTAEEVYSEKQDSSYEIVTGANAEGETIPTELTVQVGRSQRSLDADSLYDAVVAAFMSNDFTPLEFDYDESTYAPVDLDSLYDELCTDMKDAYYDNERKEIIDAQEGYGFDLAAAKQKQAMAEEGSTFTISLSAVQPAVTRETLQEKLFHDVLASYDSPHVTNWSRTNNLDLACKAINGTVLNSGDIFSFNDIVGERTAAKGYQPATVYVSGESKPELGGGVCQVASTIYLCCVLADLNVVERTEHMFLVSYVPMGADATIYWGSLDFKFENSTPYPLRIEASVSDGYVHIRLIGTKENDETIQVESVTTATIPWSEVEKEDETKPEGYRETTQSPYTGYAVTLYIQRYDADGNKIGEREPAQYPYSRYSKRDRITIVGTGKPEEEEPPEGTDPNAPVDPTEPGEPSNPLDPTTPVDPTVPIEPTDPTLPTEPVDPVPPEPVEPIDPWTPLDPEPDPEPEPSDDPALPANPFDTEVTS